MWVLITTSSDGAVRKVNSFHTALQISGCKLYRIIYIFYYYIKCPIKAISLKTIYNEELIILLYGFRLIFRNDMTGDRFY